MISDHGKKFVSEDFNALCRTLEICRVITVPYWPQSNQTERFNRTFIQMLSTYIKYYHNHWDQYLQQFAFALRTAIYDSIGKILAELFLGRKNLIPFVCLVIVPEKNHRFECTDMDILDKKAQQKLGKAQKIQAKCYNMRRRTINVKVGDFIRSPFFKFQSK